jgi:hypothetical protein
MQGIYVLQLAVFIGAGLAQAFTARRFLAAAARHDPSIAAVLDEPFLEAVTAAPTRLFLIVARMTRVRLSALARHSPDLEVERLRRWSLLWTGIALAAFVSIVFLP